MTIDRGHGEKTFSMTYQPAEQDDDAPHFLRGEVGVIIPARNEAEQIGLTLQSLLAQTKRALRIIVVINNCTDGGATAQKARSFPGVEVIEMTDNPFLKAGALNEGVKKILQAAMLPEFLMTMDADTIPDPDFLMTTTNVLHCRPEVGAISTVCDGKRGLGKTWFEKALALGQQLEYARAGFTRIRQNIHTMSGAGSVIRTIAALDVVEARGVLFAERADNLVEDFEATLEIKRMGWKVINNYYCHVHTDLMLTIPDLMKQRIRWVHGTINELRRRGWQKESWASILTMWYAFLSIPIFYFWILLVSTYFMLVATPVLTDFWFLTLVVAFQVASVYRLGWKMMLLAATVLPDLLFGVLRHVWIIASLAKSYGRRVIKAPTPQAQPELTW